MASTFSVFLLATAAEAQDLPLRPNQQLHLKADIWKEEEQVRLLEIHDDKLVVMLAERRVDVPLVTVQRIQVQGRDPVGNGATTGAFVLGLWCVFICGQATTSGTQHLTAIAVNTAFGAGLGALMDLSVQGRVTVYPRVDKVSLMSGGRPGVFLNLSF